MKKTFLALTVASLFSATAAQAAPQDNTWYAGAKLGWSHYTHVNLSQQASNPSNRDKSDVGAGVFAGYQITPWLAIEGGYDYLGQMKYNFVDGRRKLMTQGIQLSAKLGYEVIEDFDLYTRVGVMGYRANGKNSHDTGASPVVALGGEYAYNPNWAVRAEYQWISDVGNKAKVGARPDSNLLSLGVVYRFGQTVAAPAIEPVVVAPTIETKRFTLTSDVLFNFNKASLKEEGKVALSKMYQEMSNMGLKDQSTVVLGYTDRIGSEAYNLKLSTQRAETVAKFLVNLGLPESNLSVKGMGEANPVTGTQCDTEKNRNKLIACLAADRRVDIEIQGAKDIVTE
ncbi:MAG: porin OmpA [Plesiomonas sp.]|uniref:porin OmpA n=1 Tax=Plesiomonas sp. TaxID=2486279 RepID=UPI003F2E8231